MGSFALPTGQHQDPTRRKEVEDLRKKVQAVLRPGCELLPETTWARFLHWHLSPLSFEWKVSFSRWAKSTTPQWVVSKIVVKSTKQTPPPKDQKAKWDSHHWREIKADGTLGAILMPGSVNNSPPPETKSTKRKLEIAQQTVNSSEHNAKRHAAWFLEVVKENKVLARMYEEGQKQLKTYEEERQELISRIVQQDNLEKDRKAYIKRLEKKVELNKLKREEAKEKLKIYNFSIESNIR